MQALAIWFVAYSPIQAPIVVALPAVGIDQHVPSRLAVVHPTPEAASAAVQVEQAVVLPTVQQPAAAQAEEVAEVINPNLHTVYTLPICWDSKPIPIQHNK